MPSSGRMSYDKRCTTYSWQHCRQNNDIHPSTVTLSNKHLIQFQRLTYQGRLHPIKHLLVTSFPFQWTTAASCFSSLIAGEFEAGLRRRFIRPVRLHTGRQAPPNLHRVCQSNLSFDWSRLVLRRRNRSADGMFSVIRVLRGEITTRPLVTLRERARWTPIYKR